MKLCDKLKFYRENADLTQQQVSDTVGIQRGAYAYYETGKCAPKIETLKKLATLYKISVDELVDYTPVNKVAQNSDPEFNTGWSTTDKFNDLSEFEQSVILKVRLMSKEEKNKLMSFLCD